jgi:hypothetical protein
MSLINEALKRAEQERRAAPPKSPPEVPPWYEPPPPALVEAPVARRTSPAGAIMLTLVVVGLVGTGVYFLMVNRDALPQRAAGSGTTTAPTAELSVVATVNPLTQQNWTQIPPAAPPDPVTPPPAASTPPPSAPPAEAKPSVAVGHNSVPEAQPPSTPVAAPANPSPTAPPPVVAAPPRTPEPSVEPPSHDAYRLGGIIRSDKGAYALVNDRMVGEGDEIDGAKVVAIGQNSVELVKDGKKIVLRM